MSRPPYVLGVGPLADAIAAELVKYAPVRGPTSAVLHAGAPFVIAALCPSLPHTEGAVQRHALEAQVPLLIAGIDGDDGIVGPWVIPGRPGCVACLRHRQRAARSNRTYFDRLTHGPVQGPWPGELPVPGVAIQVLAAMSAQAAHAGATGDATGLECAAYFLSVHQLTGQRHVFAPVPTCPECGTRPIDDPCAGSLEFRPRRKVSPRIYRAAGTPIEDLPLRAHLYDWRTGVVTRLARQEASRRMAAVWAYVPSPPNELHALGIGRGYSFADGERVALLEALERYSGWEPLSRRTGARGTFLDFQPYAVDPARLAQHEPGENGEAPAPFVRYHPRLEMNWVWGYSFHRSAGVLIPETCAYYRLPRAPADRPHHHFVYEISNGCALGSCLEEAVLHGLLEVIERDAFLLAWYARAAARELTPSDVADRRIALLIDNLAADGYCTRVFDVTTEFGVPCLWVLAERADGQMPATLSSAGAHFDPEKALLGALVEIASTVQAMSSLGAEDRERGLAAVRDPDLVRDMDDHGLLYAQPEARERLDFLLDADALRPPVPFRDAFRDWYTRVPGINLTEDLHALVQRVLAEGEDVWVVDQTSPEARALGLTVVKVLMTGTLAMTFGHRFRRTTGVRRLLEAPARLGWRTGLLTSAEVNPHPHPFP